MKIFTITPVKNESHRYLQSCIRNARLYSDASLVYDDGSTDVSFDIALDEGAIVTERSPAESSFLEHESKFREQMWNAFELICEPEPGDWVLAIDSDEALIVEDETSSIRDVLESCAYKAMSSNAQSCLIEIPEFFAVNSEGIPMRRVDGLWGTIRGTRFFKWQPGGHYADKKMGSPAEPTYVAAGAFSATSGIWLGHWGYAHADDQKIKYDRYSKHAGHATSHVESIVSTPTLVPWDHDVPVMYRGMR